MDSNSHITNVKPNGKVKHMSKDAGVLYTPEYENPSSSNGNVESNLLSTNNDSYVAVEPTATEYNMNHERRGKCIIFNHEHFDNGSERRGTKKDEERITETFKMLGFEVFAYYNSTVSEIFSIVDELSKEDHTNADCLVMFVLTHGDTNGFLSAKDGSYNILKLYEDFTGDRCPSLARKPKIFFINACRGEKEDRGIIPKKIEKDSGKIDVYNIPKHADFLFAYSTTEDYVSFRDPDNGSWYIQELCNALWKNHNSEHLLDILMIAQRRVAVHYDTTDSTYTHELRQAPSYTSMLIRKIYFKTKDANTNNN